VACVRRVRVSCQFVTVRVRGSAHFVGLVPLPAIEIRLAPSFGAPFSSLTTNNHDGYSSPSWPFVSICPTPPFYPLILNPTSSHLLRHRLLARVSSSATHSHSTCLCNPRPRFCLSGPGLPARGSHRRSFSFLICSVPLLRITRTSTPSTSS